MRQKIKNSPFAKALFDIIDKKDHNTDPKSRYRRFITKEALQVFLKTAAVFGTSSVVIWISNDCRFRRSDNDKWDVEKIQYLELGCCLLYLTLTVTLRCFRRKYEIAPLQQKINELSQLINPQHTEMENMVFSEKKDEFVLLVRSEIPEHKEIYPYNERMVFTAMDQIKDGLIGALFGFCSSLMGIFIYQSNILGDIKQNGCFSDFTFFSWIGIISGVTMGFLAYRYDDMTQNKLELMQKYNAYLTLKKSFDESKNKGRENSSSYSLSQ